MYYWTQKLTKYKRGKISQGNGRGREVGTLGTDGTDLKGKAEAGRASATGESDGTDLKGMGEAKGACAMDEGDGTYL